MAERIDPFSTLISENNEGEFFASYPKWNSYETRASIGLHDLYDRFKRRELFILGPATPTLTIASFISHGQDSNNWIPTALIAVALATGFKLAETITIRSHISLVRASLTSHLNRLER